MKSGWQRVTSQSVPAVSLKNMDDRSKITKTLWFELDRFRLREGTHSMFTYISVAFIQFVRAMFAYYALKLVMLSLQVGEVSMFADGIASLVALVQGTKVFLFLFDDKAITRLLKAPEWFWSSDACVNIEKTAWRTLVYFHYVTYCTVTGVLYIPTIILREMPFPGDFPVFPGSFALFGGLQCLQFTYDCFLIQLCDSIFMTLVLMIYGQFAVLNERLTHIGNNAKLGKAMHPEIEACIKHHIRLLDLCQHTIDTYKVVLACQFLVTIMAICLETFAFTARDLKSKIGRGVYLAALLTQLSLYCLPAESLSNESALTTNAMFYTDWFEDAYFSKTYVQHIIRRANVPVIFTAGGIVIINKATYVTVFQNFLSIYTLLKDLRASE